MSPVTEKPLGSVAAASPEDTQIAFDAAAAAMDALAEMGGFGRADALHKAADTMIARTDEAAKMISTETGKPIAQSGREWGLACDQFRWYAEEARRIYGRTVESRVPGGRFEISREPPWASSARLRPGTFRPLSRRANLLRRSRLVVRSCCVRRLKRPALRWFWWIVCAQPASPTAP